MLHERPDLESANARTRPIMLNRQRAHILACCIAASTAAAVGSPPALAQDGPRLAQESARLQAQGNLEQALALLTEALGDTRLTNDRRAAIFTDRGALLARLNQPKAAIEDFNRAVQLYPEYPAIYNNRGSTLLTLGLAREAIKDFDRAVVLAPGYVAAYNNRAGARLLLGQHDGAIADFSRAIELAPETVAALAGRGRAQLASRRPQAAVRDLTHALATDNRFALAYRLRAEARIASDRINEAIEDLSRAVAFEPNNAEIYIERGNAYQHADNPGAAIKDFTRAIEIDGQSIAALEARAFTNVRIDATNEAEADITRALELSPRATGAMAARAQLYLNTGQPDLSRREIDRALKLTPPRAEVLLVKANIEAAAGKRDEAVQTYRAVLAENPLSRDAANALVRLTGIDDRNEAEEIRGHGVDHWRVLKRGSRYIAVSDQLPRLTVHLETIENAPPKLVEYEVAKPPNAHIAVLRFTSGPAPASPVVDAGQQAAILDLSQSTVLAVLPERRGPRQARWNWEDNRLVITAADGLTDEFPLRGVGRPAAVASAPQQRRSGSDAARYGTPTWLPLGSAPPQQQRRANRQPKTLFDMIFGN
jgi:tetratricopeptide (TPR) repeat protein